MIKGHSVYTAILTFLSMIGAASAKDTFPAFNLTPIEIVIPTNTPGLLPDLVAEKKGTNIIYRGQGQIFTDAAAGQLQSKEEGFSGTSDRSTPWKLLTEFVAVAKEGSPEEKVKSFYSESSRAKIEKIFKNEQSKARFQAFGSSVTTTQVLLCHSDSDEPGLFAYVKMTHDDGEISILPYYFVKNGNNYEIAARTINQNSTNNMHVNIFTFLSSVHETNLVAAPIVTPSAK